MDITITLKDLMFFVIFCFLTTVMVFLIIALRNFNALLRDARKILEVNKGNINHTLEGLPEITKNTNELVIGLKRGVDMAEGAIHTVGDTLAETAAGISQTTSHITSYGRIISDVIKVVTGIFSKGDK